MKFALLCLITVTVTIISTKLVLADQGEIPQENVQLSEELQELQNEYVMEKREKQRKQSGAAEVAPTQAAVEAPNEAPIVRKKYGPCLHPDGTYCKFCDYKIPEDSDTGRYVECGGVDFPYGYGSKSVIYQ